VEQSAVVHATSAALSIANEIGLLASDAVLLRNTNKLALRLLPCDVFARVAPAELGYGPFEVDIAQQLMSVGTPVAELEARVEPRFYEREGFDVSFWTYYEPVAADVRPAEYGQALHRLHVGMREIVAPIVTPHFRQRVADPAGNVDSTALLDANDRTFLRRVLRELEHAVVDHRAPEQLIHGEPHTGNVLSTTSGAKLIDLETCCLGPVEFDVAHAPTTVDEHYPNANKALIDDCRGLMLAMIAKHRCAPDDQFPNRRRAPRDLIGALRAGPPWPSLETVITL